MLCTGDRGAMRACSGNLPPGAGATTSANRAEAPSPGGQHTQKKKIMISQPRIPILALSINSKLSSLIYTDMLTCYILNTYWTVYCPEELNMCHSLQLAGYLALNM